MQTENIFFSIPRMFKENKPNIYSVHRLQTTDFQKMEAADIYG